MGQLGADAASAAPALVDALAGDPRQDIRSRAASALGMVGRRAQEPSLLTGICVVGGAGAAGCLAAAGLAQVIHCCQKSPVFHSESLFVGGF